MSDERIHKHDWENGRCKVCGALKQEAKNESTTETRWKHEPVTSEQAKQILEVLKGIKKCCVWILLFVIYIWLRTLFIK